MVRPTISKLNHDALLGRALEEGWEVNTPELEAKQEATNGTTIVTRFPPEPNGYLHIGHAKSMNMNFSLAFEKLGVEKADRKTIFRYDDTNPEAESKEYIDSLRRDLEWLGWNPVRTTYSSDNFQALYDFAIILINKGLAYCCDMTGDEMKAQRELALNRVNCKNSGKDPDAEFPIPSPDVLPGRNRNTSPQRNLELFTKMTMGFFPEGSWTLRLKMELESSNPNMYDLVAYRIKYMAHPHAGKGWCIYPAYDWTHGICDSLENVDYSICTLEFENRREPYYWILWALDLYRPHVYEMSRLNLQYTVLSKRRLLKLVNNHYVRGWDDPRMPTISGLRRRGYTAQILNTFCNDLGATRAANVIDYEKLANVARTCLAHSRRVMAALSPIKITLSNWDSEGGAESMTYDVQNSPTDASFGSHKITLTNPFYIDASDFRLEDETGYYGLAPNKAVGLKYYGGNIICDEVKKDGNGKVVELICRMDHSEGRPKPQTYISWVPSNSLKAEVRVYNHLFVVSEPSELWEEELNPNSEIVYADALVDPSIAEIVDYRNVDKWTSNVAVQLERMGYFVVDTDTKFDPTSGSGALVLNRTVSLREDVAKKVETKADQKAKDDQRAKQAADAAKKEARMKIAPVDLFRLADEYKGLYSKFDEETGLPTHDADGKEVTKSAKKKLAKEQMKHKKAYEAAAKKK